MIRLLHTADWHLGRRFSSFPEEAQKKLTRARLDAVEKIFELALRNRVDAVLCAGDLFDAPDPPAAWWGGLADRLHRYADAPMPPVILVPGNHDPLVAGSVWARDHALRGRLPRWAHVVDRPDFALPIGDGAVVYAAPCTSTSGQADPALTLPARADGDERIRIGCVHGQTFDIAGFEFNFPIAKDAGVRRGLDYLAIGDTHAFRDVTPDGPVPTVYPGSPEPMTFAETEAGFVALVGLFPHGGRRPRVERERVGAWTWRERVVQSVAELATLLSERDLDRVVLRLRLELEVSVAEEGEVDRILGQLGGTDVNHGAVGILVVDRTKLALSVSTPEDFEAALPPVLQETVRRLRAVAVATEDPKEQAVAARAIAQLYRTLRRLDREEAR